MRVQHFFACLPPCQLWWQRRDWNGCSWLQPAVSSQWSLLTPFPFPLLLTQRQQSAVTNSPWNIPSAPRGAQAHAATMVSCDFQPTGLFWHKLAGFYITVERFFVGFSRQLVSFLFLSYKQGTYSVPGVLWEISGLWQLSGRQLGGFHCITWTINTSNQREDNETFLNIHTCRR